MSDTKILSDRAHREWIPSCPVQVKHTRVTSDGNNLSLTVTSVPCGGFKLSGFTADIDYTGAKRQSVGHVENVSLSVGESSPLDVPFADAVYAAVTVRTVTYADGKTWSNPGNTPGIPLPEQDIYWQTDPLYEAIRVECSGVTEPKYKPDALDGAWRCTCGQVNLDESPTCGACGCSLEWLNTHLDPAYLEERKKEIADKTEEEAIKIKKKRERGVSDQVKMVAILAGFVAVVVLVILTFTLFIPSAKYSKAVRLADDGSFDESIAIFTELDNFRDAKAKVSDTNYRKAQAITGLDEVNMVSSAKESWYSITPDGILSFKKDEYEDHGGTWEHFVIPDVVDNVVVRELDRNFFMNCKELEVVTISDCVEIIGEQTFYNCENLKTVHFGKNVTKILSRAFINCVSLTEMKIPDTVTTLGLRAFNNCIRLNKVVLGAGITEIGSYQFSLCVELERITLNSPITTVGEYAFSECEKFVKIHCRFDQSAWTEPTLETGNEAFANAEVIFE